MDVASLELETRNIIVCWHNNVAYFIQSDTDSIQKW